MSAPDAALDLARFGPVTRDLAELKRMRDASSTDSVAERLFRRAWSRLASGEAAGAVWPSIVAEALAATRLAGIDSTLLATLEVDPATRVAILRRAFDEATISLDAERLTLVRDRLDEASPAPDAAPGFAAALIRQPRAGATSPGKPRLALEPAESHGDHCLVVAVLAALLALHEGGEPSRVFVAGLAHHLHNAMLPDTGFAGEMMLGEALVPLMQRLFERELRSLPPDPRAAVEDALLLIVDADTAEGRAFHAADVVDRVLQAHHHARAAAFTAEQALDDLQLVHEGPLRPFQARVLAGIGLA